MCKAIIAVLLLCTLIGCNADEATPTESNDSAATISLATPGLRAIVHPHEPYDSFALLKIDTSTLAGKRQEILRDFALQYFMHGDDTLFDLNFDGHPDYVIRYYASAGTGIKNAILVYLYEPRYNSYAANKQLSRLRNPSFFIPRKKITQFYLALGGGDGEQLEWIKGEWITTKSFQVSNQDENSQWTIVHHLTNDTVRRIMPYQMIPPLEILKTDFFNY